MTYSTQTFINSLQHGKATSYCLLFQVCLLSPLIKGIWILYWRELIFITIIKQNSINFGLVLVFLFFVLFCLSKVSSWWVQVLMSPQVISLLSLLGCHLLMDLSSAFRCFICLMISGCPDWKDQIKSHLWLFIFGEDLSINSTQC